MTLAVSAFFALLLIVASDLVVGTTVSLVHTWSRRNDFQYAIAAFVSVAVLSFFTTEHVFEREDGVAIFQTTECVLVTPTRDRLGRGLAIEKMSSDRHLRQQL